ncbi:uncharacterized protein LOC126834319 [Adelges cooleyi]|uniref:uncharacterized protein LOC126834319 n=1 Tax=Adelges cooleyi TaxID=133065 RepID=UPI0021803374|nr:uncharacterized protein LOC126834319 [Adelges cooleyi]
MVVSGDDHVMDVLLDRLAPLTTRTAENMEKIRKIACKLNGRVNNVDKNVKAKSLNMLRKTKSERLVDIMKLFEKTKDKSTCTYLAGVIHACVAPKSGSIRMTVLKQLVKLDATKIFMKSVVDLHSKSVGSHDTLMNELFFILGQLSQKDSKFSKQAELLNVAKAFHQHLKNNIKNTKLVTALMLCAKTFTKNENIVAVLLKDNFVMTMEKLLRENRKHLKKNKQWVFLVILANISKKISEDGCERLVRGGLMQYALDVFDVKQYSTNKTNSKIFSSALDTLVHVSATNNGRTALKKSNRCNILCVFINNCPIDRIYNSTLSKLCTVINVCQDKTVLPLATIQSSYSFGLGDVKTGDCERDEYAGTDSDGSDNEENDQTVVQNLAEPTENFVVRKSESVKFEITFNYWKDPDELVAMYGRLFEEYNGETSKTTTAPLYKVRAGLSANSTTALMTSFAKFKSSKYFSGRNDSITPGDNVNLEKEEIRLLNNLRKTQTHRAAYSSIAKRVNSVVPLVKIAYPDWVGADENSPLEPLYNSDVHISRNKLLSCMENIGKRKDCGDLIVYDLDYLLATFNDPKRFLPLTNEDERLINSKSCFEHLHFESRFESGNLRKAIRIGANEYDLILNSDVNSNSHNQWFYFQVSNMMAFKPFVFNIVNMEKNSSQFKNGLQPIIFSVKSHMELKQGWRRTGVDISYYINQYKSGSKANGSYMTASFTIQFPYDLDVCYIAYVYPYTYSTLLYKCFNWKNSIDPKTTIFRANSMCRSLNNNDVPVLTITSVENEYNKIQNRPIVYLTSRVHPGETSSSWVIDGAIEFLCSDSITAKKAKDTYVFKIVPMLNVEGVINGCHRCGLTNEDLNRKWNAPDPKLHPEIFHARGILEYMAQIMKTAPHVYCDFHGHSSRKNCFFYGCSSKKSWSRMDLAKYENETDFMVLPILMQNCGPSFSLSQCKYKVERNRETTARITVWRCYGVKRSYTLETSYCGCDEGLYKGFHLGIRQLKEIGSTFCMALSSLDEETKKRENMPSNIRLTSIATSCSTKSMDFIEEENVSDSD